MRVKMSSMRLAMIAIVGGATLSQPVMAQEVTLTSSDGTLNMTGEFLDFQDNAYIINTSLGELRVSASRVSCNGLACPNLGGNVADIVVGGSETVGLGLMPLLLEGYAGSIDAAATLVNTGNRNDIVVDLVSDQGFGEDIASILVNSSTSTDGFEELLAEQIDISMASRRILPAEARALREDGAGNMVSAEQEHVVAIDSLVIITNASNTVDTLTTDQLRQIYTGQVTNWSELGGENVPITVIDRFSGSGTRVVFEDRIFGEPNTTSAANSIPAVTNSEASQLVDETRGAIGYVGYAFQRGTNAITLINECGIAATPDAFSARTEEYALQRRLYLYTRADTASDQADAFIDYATSPAADGLISKAGFIGFAVDRREQSLDGARAVMLRDPSADAYEAGFMREMLAQMDGYDRLSTTFRFRTGSAQLDERGRIDKERLITYLQTQPAGSELLLVGFTDDVGQFDGNLGLSRQRAAQVAADLQASVGETLPDLTISSVGFGEIAPSGCNSTDEGRRINRRVEVWIKSPV